MSSFSLALSFVVLALVVDQTFAQSYNQRVTLYSGNDCKGSYVVVTEQYSADLRQLAFDNYAYSAKLTGVWHFYDLVNYNTNYDALMEYAFGRNEFCINFQNLRAKTSSIRFSGSPNDYRSNTLTLYKGTYFQEQEEYLINHATNLALQQHASLVITGISPWTLYDEANYRGNAICVYPPDNNYTPALIFDLTTIDVPHNKIRSVALGCHGKKIVRAPVQLQARASSLGEHGSNSV